LEADLAGITQYLAVLNGTARAFLAGSDASTTPVLAPAHTLVDANGVPVSGAAPLPVKPGAGTLVDRSVTSAATGTLAAANPGRTSLSFQVPTALTSGLWVPALSASLGCLNPNPGTLVACRGLSGGVPGRAYKVAITATTAARTYQWLVGVVCDPVLAVWPLIDPPSPDFGAPHALSAPSFDEFGDAMMWTLTDDAAFMIVGG
jgi:hypothetical protein